MVWCRFFLTVYADFSRFVRDINGEKKNISLLMIFFTVSFSRFAPSRNSIKRRRSRKKRKVRTSSTRKNRKTENREEWLCQRWLWVTRIQNPLVPRYLLNGPVRDTPPHIAQYPFEIASQRGVSHAFSLVFIGYRASIAEIPLLGGGIAPPLCMLLRGETLRKGEGVSHPIGHVETPKTP